VILIILDILAAETISESKRGSMKCPNCSSAMYLFDQNATKRSLVTFYRCTNCIGEHISAEPLDTMRLNTEDDGLFASNSPLQHKQLLMV